MKRSAAAALLVLLAAGCRTPTPIETGATLAPDDPAVRARLDAWIGGAHARAGLRGRARLSVDSEDGEIRVRSRHVLVARRPAQLRVEVLGFLNQSVAIVVTDGARFEVFEVQDRVYRSGDVGPALLWEEARIALTPTEVIEVLLAAPVGEPDWTSGSARGAVDGEIRIDRLDAEGALRQRVALDAAGRLTSVERFDAVGRPLWRARYTDFREIAGSALAHEIELDVSAGQTHARIALSDVELNPELDDDMFRLERSGPTLPEDAGGGPGR